MEKWKSDCKRWKETILELATSSENKLIARRLDLTLEDKRILLIDMACPNEYNKIAKRDEEIAKYNRLCFKLHDESDSNNYWMPWRRNERTEREYQTDFRIRK